MAALAIILVAGFNLNAIASIGSAVALLIFSSVSVAHLRVRRETGASLVMILIGLVATLGTFVIFCTTTLVTEPATALALVLIIALAVVVDFAWKAARGRRKAARTRAAL